MNEDFFNKMFGPESPIQRARAPQRLAELATLQAEVEKIQATIDAQWKRLAEIEEAKKTHDKALLASLDVPAMSLDELCRLIGTLPDGRTRGVLLRAAYDLQFGPAEPKPDA